MILYFSLYIDLQETFENLHPNVGYDDKPWLSKEELKSKSAYKLVGTEKDGTMIFQAKILTAVGSLSDGTSFGEQSIIYNKNRAATIQTSEDTHFAVLQK